VIDAYPSLHGRLIQQICNLSHSQYDAVVMEGHSAQLFRWASMIVRKVEVLQLLLHVQDDIGQVHRPLEPFYRSMMQSGFRLTVLDIDYEDLSFQKLFMGFIHPNATHLPQCPKYETGNQ